LLVTGRAPRPVCLVIEEGGVRLEPAAALWGLGTQATQDALKLDEAAGALAIGPAGENGVRYASVASRRRFFGRGGLGAVMGAKNLKAIVAAGGAYEQVPHDPGAFTKDTARARAQIDHAAFTAQLYRTYGTDVHVNLCNRTGILPVRNFRDGSSPEAAAVAGETLARRYRSEHSACQACTILCGHKGAYPDGTVRQLPEYETTALFGPNLGVFDPDVIGEWNDLCCDLGMDTMSAAGTLAFVMEAGEQGLLKTSLKFGAPEGVSETLQDIAYRRGAGDELANGSRWLAEKHGGMAFAIQVKGLEMAAYDPRGAWGQGLAFAVANRGADHLSAPVFPLETFFSYLPPDTTRSKVQFTIFFENFAAALNALGVCLFTAFAYLFEAPVVKATPKPLLSLVMRAAPDVAVQLLDISAYTDQLTSSSGLKLSQRELLRAGERIHVLERWMNAREGITRCDDALPSRFLTEGRTCDPRRATVPQDRLLAGYYRTRGYDANGVPTASLLQRLGIPADPQAAQPSPA
jgi:aldehyde:ferredoxin oxidoreductase